MEVDSYHSHLKDSIRESSAIKWFSRITHGCILGGGVIALGGISYSDIVNPVMPPVLENYYYLEKEFDKILQINSRDLESRSAELIARAKRLEAKRYEVMQTPNFAETKESYESEVKNIESIEYALTLGGVGLISLSVIPAFLSYRRRREECLDSSKTS